MKLSISNIGWTIDSDEEVFKLMKHYGFQGLEIAPTRVFAEAPYDKLKEANTWSKCLKHNYGFDIPSMQSIWFGRQEKLFGTIEERRVLVEYTKKAIDFAEAIGCRNLVFGCPRNRNMEQVTDERIAIAFFEEIGDYAAKHGTVVGMEANPPIYNTNFINDTKSALELIDSVDSTGFKLNLDLGTIIHNKENLSELVGKVHMISHVHISEPGLKPIEKRTIHSELKDILLNEGYEGFVSIEMGKTDILSTLEEKMDYIRGVFKE